jgi:CBS-domain-containing membrane protein
MAIFEKFKKLWKYYLFQSFLAGVAIFIVVLTLGRDRVVVIASMGATAFICFAMPKSVSARTRNAVGGHLVGLICGTIFTFTVLPYYVEFPLAVGLAIFLMVALDVEHPPAAGTALAVTINEVTLATAVAIVISVIVLTQCRYYMRNLLKDLV